VASRRDGDSYSWRLATLERAQKPDNTKVVIIKARLYEAAGQSGYADLAAYYDTAILPAGPRQ